MALHNQHVYMYYRWKMWIAQGLGKLWAAFLLGEMAIQEKKDQERA